MGFFDEAISAMTELYSRGIVASLATVKENKPNARMVDAYFKEDKFYVVTHALSGKIQEIAKNPHVALNHNLFVAHGTGKNLGNPLADENAELRDELKQVFRAFYDKHVNEADENTCILKIELSDAMVFAHDYKYVVDFENKTATRVDWVIDVIY